MASVALLLIRVVRSRGKFRSKVRVCHCASDTSDVCVAFHNKRGVVNSNLNTDSPAPGVIIYQFEQVAAIGPGCKRVPR